MSCQTHFFRGGGEVEVAKLHLGGGPFGGGFKYALPYFRP